MIRFWLKIMAIATAATVCLVLCTVSIYSDSATIVDAYAADYEIAFFPGSVLQVSQGAYNEYNAYSHGSQNAFDLVGNSNYAAPFTGKIVSIYAPYSTVAFQSTDKVYYADGTLDYMTVSFQHDNDISDLYVGKIIKQGEVFYQPGVKDPTGATTGSHLHIAVKRGAIDKYFFSGDVYPNKALSLRKGTTIKQTGGYSWVTKDDLPPKKWYETVPLANLGDSFDALILNKAAGIPIRTISSTNVVTHPEEWTTSEMWRFTRQSNGSYKIVNFGNGLCLDADCSGTTDGTNIGSVASNGYSAQRWFIYSVNGGYAFRPAYGELAMDSWGDSTSNGNNVHLWTYQGHDAQIFSVYNNGVSNYAKPNPSAPALSVKSHTSIALSWKQTAYTEKYNIYRSTDNSSWKKIGETTSMSYTDTGLSANTKYYYKYESVNRFYTVSSPSASATTQQIPTYTVVFNKNNGSGTMSNQTMKRDQSANLTANAYTKTGYSFAGWNTKADGSGTSYADKASVKNLASGGGSMTLYAQWKANQYSVTLVYNDGTDKSETVKVTYDSAYGLKEPEREGYFFNGWFTAATGGTQVAANAKVAVTSNQTLYAHWSKDQLTLTFNSMGGTEITDSKLLTYDNRFGPLPEAERTGYIFEGWYLDEAYTKPITETDVVKATGNQTVYAKWSIRQYIVTFDAGEGTSDAENKKVVYGKAYGVLPDATWSDREFIGWFTEDGAEITSESIVKLEQDTILYAKWQLKGDVNVDGVFDIQDVIMVQDWLLAKSDATLTNWRAADACQDERIDVFDLTLLKSWLIEMEGDMQ